MTVPPMTKLLACPPCSTVTCPPSISSCLAREIRYQRVQNDHTRRRCTQARIADRLDKPFIKQHANAIRRKSMARKPFIAIEVDPLDKPQAHQQKLVGLFRSRQR